MEGACSQVGVGVVPALDGAKEGGCRVGAVCGEHGESGDSCARTTRDLHLQTVGRRCSVERISAADHVLAHAAQDGAVVGPSNLDGAGADCE